jgi:hypothetical protein
MAVRGSLVHGEMFHVEQLRLWRERTRAKQGFPPDARSMLKM